DGTRIDTEGPSQTSATGQITSPSDGPVHNPPSSNATQRVSASSPHTSSERPPAGSTVLKPKRPFDEFLREEGRAGWRDLPSLLRRAFGLVWAAGRKEFLVTSALQLVSAF